MRYGLAMVLQKIRTNRRYIKRQEELPHTVMEAATSYLPSVSLETPESW